MLAKYFVGEAVEKLALPYILVGIQNGTVLIKIRQGPL